MSLTRVLGRLVATASDRSDRHLGYLRDGAEFDRWVARRLARVELHPGRDSFFAFNTGCLESLQLLAHCGVVTMVDQIDPARVEDTIVREESARWPGWQDIGPEVPASYWSRLQEEWRAASIVVVNSEWTRDALVAQDVPSRKIAVVPQACEMTGGIGSATDAPAARRLVVLWVGSVNLRKGIPYVLAAADQLRSEPVEFVVVGPIDIEPWVVASAPPNVRFVGRIPVGEVERWYRVAHVLLFPTLSDGFGRVQLEAMAHGLPVITTDRCGRVVEHGRDGLLVEARSTDAIVSALREIAGNPGWREEMGNNARAKAAQFTLERFAAAIENLVMQHGIS
jgi:glycosyltransferase involved in cell wall biosynthesis